MVCKAGRLSEEKSMVGKRVIDGGWKMFGLKPI